MKSTRRELLGRLAYGLGLLPYLALAPRSLLGTLLFDPEAVARPPKALPPNPFLSDGRALVAVVHGEALPAMLDEGLRLLGGLERLGAAGRRVLIKPNVVNDRPAPATTSAAVVGAVARHVRAVAPDEVVVADSSGMLRFPTSKNLAATGIGEAAARAGARLLTLETEPWVRIEADEARGVPRFHVSAPVYESDIFINLPVVKTHRFAHYSCSLKNLVGIVHPRDRPSLRFLAGNWHERIAELNTAVHPHLTIADATTVMIEGGPTSGTPATANLLLMSGDRIALDAVAVALLRTFGTWPKVMSGSVWSQRQIRRAIELTLGVRGADEVRLVTASVSGRDGEFERRMERVRRELGQA